MPGWIISGIDTGVGKTLVAAILARSQQMDYWKPIEAGGEDSARVAFLSGRKAYPSAYLLSHPLSPHHAAALENQEIKTLSPPKKNLIVEGCGGVMAPVNTSQVISDLFTAWNWPWIVVSRHYLGSLNHTLLSVEWLKQRRQKIVGIIFNGHPYPEGEEFILSYTSLPCVGRIFPEKKITKKIVKCYAQKFQESWLEI